MAVRLQDVAERAGVSVRTVSNVVNGFPHVSPTTRASVQAVLDELGYRPNASARQLRLGRSETISLAVPEIDSPYFSEVAALLVSQAANRGWTVHIDQTDADPDRERQMVGGPGSRAVDGVIASPWALTPEELAAAAHRPLVLLGEQQPVGRVDHVAIDNVAAAREATDHLLESGRRRLAVIGLQPHLANDTARLREHGYRQALAARDLPVQEPLLLAVRKLHRPDGAAAMRQLLDLDADIDAVFCFTDQLALGAIRTLADRGVRVPEDIAVLGWDDIEDGRYSVPSLTTISPDKGQLASLALDCLRTRIEDPSAEGRSVVAGHRLIVRESTGGD